MVVKVVRGKQEKTVFMLQIYNKQQLVQQTVEVTYIHLQTIQVSLLNQIQTVAVQLEWV